MDNEIEEDSNKRWLDGIQQACKDDAIRDRKTCPKHAEMECVHKEAAVVASPALPTQLQNWHSEECKLANSRPPITLFIHKKNDKI